MKRLIIAMVVLLTITGCSSTPPTQDPAAVQKMVAGTVSVIDTLVAAYTNTPAPTKTPTPTRTPAPTRTPRPYEEFYTYINKFGEIFNQVTELTNNEEKIKLHDIHFEKIEDKTTLFIGLKNIPEKITDLSVLSLPVILIDDIRDNRKADLPKDIDMVVITSFSMENVKELTIAIKWSDLVEYVNGSITFNQLYALCKQTWN